MVVGDSIRLHPRVSLLLSIPGRPRFHRDVFELKVPNSGKTIEEGPHLHSDRAGDLVGFLTCMLLSSNRREADLVL